MRCERGRRASKGDAVRICKRTALSKLSTDNKTQNSEGLFSNLEKRQMNKNKLLRFLSLLIVVCMLALTASTAEGYIRHHRRRHNPEAGKGKAAKRIGIGAAIGAG